MNDNDFSCLIKMCVCGQWPLNITALTNKNVLIFQEPQNKQHVQANMMEL